MGTWKKFLPNATIVVLDYKNLGEFIDINEPGLKFFSDKLPLQQVSDAVRVAVLAKYGGVWLDLDTIILSSDVEKYFLPDEKHRTVFFGNSSERNCHIAFINAPPAAMCMKLWYEFNREKMWNLTKETFINFDFFGNSFINDYSKKYADEIKVLDRNPVMPELSLTSSLDTDSRQKAYVDYYFLQNLHLADIPCKMLLLHNSWTPNIFSQLSVDDFLYMDCTMVNVLAEALEIKIPPDDERFKFVVTKNV